MIVIALQDFLSICLLTQLQNHDLTNNQMFFNIYII